MVNMHKNLTINYIKIKYKLKLSVGLEMLRIKLNGMSHTILKEKL